jgi:hypothetical protein
MNKSILLILLIIIFVFAGCKNTTSADSEKLSSDTNLSSITSNIESISPSFNSNTTSYTLLVADNISNVTLTGKAEDSNSIVSYSPSQSITSLSSYADSLETITVTAQDGSKKNYAVTIIKGFDSNLYEDMIIPTPEFNVTGKYYGSPQKIIISAGGLTDVTATLDSANKTWSAIFNLSTLANGIKSITAKTTWSSSDSDIVHYNCSYTGSTNTGYKLQGTISFPTEANLGQGYYIQIFDVGNNSSSAIFQILLSMNGSQSYNFSIDGLIPGNYAIFAESYYLNSDGSWNFTNDYTHYTSSIYTITNHDITSISIMLDAP